MFKIIFSKSSANFLEKCEKIATNRILKRIEDLAKNPFPSECKRVQGQTGKVFRVRVGDFRILYEVLHQDNVVHIIKIDKRSKVYD